MATPHRNVPVLRFPEFLGKWVIKKIKSIAPLQRGFDLPTTRIKNGKYPVVYSNGILRTHNEFKVKGPSVVTGRSGTIGQVTFINKKFWPHNTSLWVTDFCGNDPKFIYYFFIQIRLKKYNAGTSIPTLNRNDVHSIKASIPESLKEQQKIASFLSSVYTKIEQLGKKKALLEQYKKGIMKKLFSQEIRFKDGQGKDYPDWEQSKLGNLGTTFNGLTGKNSTHFGKGKPYIQYLQVFENSRIDVNKFGFVEVGEDESQNKVCSGDVFFTTSSETPNEVGTASVLIDEVEDTYLNSFCFGYRVNKEYLLPQFARFSFRANGFRKKVVRLAQGSTRYNLSKTSLMKIETNLPSLHEQQKIANFLSAIDKKIELIAAQLEQARTFKKGLLQKMFI